MLVLTRRRGEEIVIGLDDVRITILTIRKDHVRIGVKAPAHVPIHRKEIYDKLVRDGKLPRKGDGR